MASIGKLKASSHDMGVAYHGTIRSLQFVAQIAMIPTGNDAGDDRKPSHEVMGRAADGQRCGLGAAWHGGEINKGPNTGKPFYRLQIDDPSFPDKLNLTAFPTEDGGLDVVWQRPRAALPSPDAIAQANRDHDRATGSTGAPDAWPRS